MAIIRSISGLKVTVVINGVTAKEYAVPDGEEGIPHNMTRDDFHVPKDYDQDLPYVAQYIEAKPGEPYWFKVKKDPSFQARSNHIAYSVSMDGFELGLKHETTKRKQRWEGTTEAFCTGNPTAGYERHKFQFAALDIVEGDKLSSTELNNHKSLAQKCGKLTVSFFRMRKTEPKEPEASTYSNRPSTNMAEKAVKGKTVDCLTTYATETNSTPPAQWLDNYNDHQKRPFAVFEFRYRTKEGLMRHGVIPRPTVAQEIQDMSEQELRQRLTEMMETTKHSHDIGQENSDENKPRIKREADEMGDDEFMARYKARRLENGRVEVDFTDD